MHLNLFEDCHHIIQPINAYAPKGISILLEPLIFGVRTLFELCHAEFIF